MRPTEEKIQKDPSDLPIYLFKQGNNCEAYRYFGAHLETRAGESGVVFRVWAPHAAAISVVGDFNSWKPGSHPMRKVDGDSVWELFIPGVKEYDVYKYCVTTRGGDLIYKADPYAFHAETRPSNGSKVYDITGFAWHDDAWQTAQKKADVINGPMNIYEMHAGSWKLKDEKIPYNYSELADELIPYIREMGYTHVELLPVMEYPFDGSWGYQVTGYFAPTSRYGTPKDFMAFVDKMHEAGIGVIMDWVPAHFPKDAFALGRFDGTPLYEDPDPLRGEHPEWGTYVFNFGRREVRNFLVANALFWLEDLHVDALRVDAVSSMLYLDYSREPGHWRPNIYGGRENLEAIDFLKEATATAYKNNPGVMVIAEESTAWPGITAPTSAGGIGFGMKWNMGWMHDTLEYLHEEPINRKWHHNEITFSMVYAYSEHYVLPISHDEVVYGKGSVFGQMPGNIILAVLACVIAYIFLNYTKIGTYTYAIGSNEFVAKNMGINVDKYKVLAFILSGAFLGVMAVLTISYGSSMVAVTGMASMSRNFVPTMGCFFGLAFKKYGMPLQAIVIGEFVINIIFFGFIAMGAPTAIQDVITGLALLIIITVTTKVTKGEIVK